MKLIGALTSKPYAFKARPWELENINSIDYHDAHGTNIKISVRGSEILRVLPRINNRINEEWISDKIRFSYDGLNKQRLFYPLYKKNNKFYKISWEESFKIIKDKFKEGFHFKGIIGQLIDLESTYVFKNLLNKLGNGNFISSMSDNDFRENYLMNTYYHDIKNANTIVLLYTNLNIESPILSLKFRNIVKNSSTSIHIIGPNSSQNFANISHGNHNKDVYNYAKNKHKLSTLFTKKNTLLYTKYNLSSNNFLKLFKSYILKKNINILHNDPAVIIQNEINLKNKAFEENYFLSKTVTYLYNTNQNVQNCNFIIYQGHTGNNYINSCNLVLPGSTLLEKNSYLYNNEGLKQELNFCIKPPALARNDWKIFDALANYFNSPLSYNSLIDIRNEITNIAPTRIFNNFTNCETYISKNRIKNNYLLQETSNFYMTDIICKSSNTLALAANRFTRQFKNFKIN